MRVMWSSFSAVMLTVLVVSFILLICTTPSTTLSGIELLLGRIFGTVAFMSIWYAAMSSLRSIRLEDEETDDRIKKRVLSEAGGKR